MIYSTYVCFTQYKSVMANFPFDSSLYLSDLFFVWIFNPLKYFRKTPPNSSNLFQIPNNILFDESLKSLQDSWINERQKKKPSFFKVITKIIFKDLLISCFEIFFGNFLNLFQAVFINLIVRYLQSPNKPSYEGVILAICFILTAVFSPAIRHNGSLKALFFTGKIKNLVAVMITDKILTLNNACVTEESTRGKIMNVVSTDMEILELMVYTLHFLTAPFIVIAAVIIIIVGFGPAGLVGIAITLLHIPIVMYFGRKTMKIRLKANKVGDTRVKMIQNLIEGIKIMKLYAWELPFLKSIFAVREKEIGILSSASKNNAFMGMLTTSGIGLAIFGSLCTQIAIGNDLNAADVFMAISVFYITQVNVVMISTVGVNTTFAYITIMKRVGQFLMLKDHRPNTTECVMQYSISLTDVTFSWREPEQTNHELETSKIGLIRSKTIIRECLREITLNILPGELVAVVGPVGCGKTSLLMGLLGELSIASGDLGIRGTIAFASEEPWILAGSIKDNILMGRTFDPDLYRSAIDSCDLGKDIAMFKNGHDTLVGDRGVTLSGGQKSRISLARAVYSAAHLLLDDPLSAVDAEVGNQSFSNALKNNSGEKPLFLPLTKYSICRKLIRC